MSDHRAPDGDDGDDDEWGEDDAGGEWRADEASDAGADDRDDGRRGGAAAPVVDAEHAAAVRTVRLVVAAVVLALLAGVAVLVSGSLDDDEEPATDDPTVLAGGEAVIGPSDGAGLDAYVAAGRDALAAAEGRRLAVVSLVSYRSEVAVDDLLEAAPGLDLVARLVALPGGEPEVIDGGVADWVVAARSSLQAERDEIAALLPTIEDPADPFIAGYTEELAALDAQLAALDPAGELVFGVLVSADAGALRRLAERPEVRLVDVAADDEVVDLAGYRGIRPDELTTAGDPPVRTA